MQLITSKAQVRPILERILSSYKAGTNDYIPLLQNELLGNKVKFPILEYCAAILFDEIPDHAQLNLCDRIEAMKAEGGNVLLGMLLQKRLNGHFHESLEKAAEYISRADAWYVCDIIGERVFGFALLNDPEKTLPELEKLAKHPSNWVVRSLGAGMHYAIKKKLPERYVRAVFELLLSLAGTNDKEIRQGVGWAAKTTARFHPGIIEAYRGRIQSSEVPAWFRAKVQIGLNRNRHAAGN